MGTQMTKTTKEDGAVAVASRSTMTAAEEQETLQKVARARTKLLFGQPFYALLAMQMDVVCRPDLPAPAGTDGDRLYVQPAAIARWSNAELSAVLAHEVEHVIRGHVWRRQHRQAVLWNIAGDLVINWDLKQAGLTLPEGCLLEARFAGMTAEAVYDKIRDDSRYQQLAADLSARWDVGSMLEPEGTALEQQASQQQWEGRMRAAAAGLPPGKTPGHVTELLDRLRKPPIDLPALLERFLLTDRCFDDYDWTYPNRNYLAQGLYLPSLRGEVMPAVGVFVDTSGSVGTAELEYFAGCLNDVLLRARPKRTYVVYCDAEVPKAGGVQEYTPGQMIDFRPVGRGGTDFRPPFRLAAREGWPLACAIYLTDLQGPFPDREPDYPTLWVTTAGGKAPWGETHELKMPDRA